MPLPDAEIERIADALADPGYTTSTLVFAPELIAELRAEALALVAAGHMVPAGTGSDRRLAPSSAAVIRGDQIFWLDPQKMSVAQKAYYTGVMSLAEALRPRLLLPLKNFEAHYAAYGTGMGYARHIDQHRGSGARLLSCVLYLNPQWQPHYGGQLRIYSTDDDSAAIMDIQPEAGTFAIFRSDTVWHAVLPATRTRLSLTGWIRRE